MHLKPVGYTDILFPTVGNAVNEQSPESSKLGIYCKKRLGKLAANISNYWSPRETTVANLPKL